MEPIQLERILGRERLMESKLTAIRAALEAETQNILPINTR